MAMNGQQTASRSAPGPSHPAPIRGRRPSRLEVVAGVVAVALVAGLVWAGLHWWGSRSEPPAKEVIGSEAMAGGAEAAKPPRKARTGSVATDGDFAFKVTGVSSPVRTLGSGANRVTAEGRYIVVKLVVKNVGAGSRPLLATVQQLHDRTGAVYVADAGVPARSSKRLWADQQPGRAIAGTMVFDVPKGTKAASVELHGSGTSAGVLVTL